MLNIDRQIIMQSSTTIQEHFEDGVHPAVSKEYQMPSPAIETKSKIQRRVETKIQATVESNDPSLCSAFEGKVRPYIDLVDNLRQLGLEEELELPAIVVIGDQSSGKSSILEAISGVQLPRGSGIVTRCPLELRLKKASNPHQSWTALASYRAGNSKDIVQVNVPDPKLTDKVIRNIQNEIAGTSTGISPELISLNVESPACPDLTLIDLPGIARTAVEGQPVDICDQIKGLLRDFCKRPQTIILCVIPSNVDVAVNEALTIAREFDPDGSRTLGVLTKPDLVDVGTEADVLSVLNNEKFFLRKGYSIVRCRGQQAINDGIDLAEAVRQENKFFEQHKVYKKVNTNQRGTSNLALKLTDNLVDHIKRTIPKLRDDVRRQVKDARSKLSDLGEGPPKDPAAKRLYFTKLAQMFLIQLESVVNNRRNVPSSIFNIFGEDIPTYWVNAAYRWRKCFQFLKDTLEFITLESFENGEMTVDQIELKKIHYRGRDLPRYVNFDFFETLVQEHLMNYLDPISECMETVSKDLVTIIEFVSQDVLSQYPGVMGKIRGISEDVQKECKENGKRLLRLEMKKEDLVYSQDDTYLRHLHDFVNTDSGPATYLITSGETDESEPNFNATMVQEILKVYFVIANRRILDNIPMLLRTTQHQEFIERLREKLQETGSGDQTDELISEDSKLADERNFWEDKCHSLTEAIRMLNCA